MRTGVRPLIEAVPEVGTILERHGIGCVQCAIGTCMLEDVAQLHALPSQDEVEMMYQIESAIYPEEDGDPSAACANLADYRALLTEHIAKEDEILYPHIDRALTTSQVGEIFRWFGDAEGGLADDIPQRYERFIISLEDRFRKE